MPLSRSRRDLGGAPGDGTGGPEGTRRPYPAYYKKESDPAPGGTGLGDVMPHEATGPSAGPSPAARGWDIARRLDALPWSGFHRRLVFALGVTWILDGLEVTLVGSLAPLLAHHFTLGLSTRELGLLASSYLAGAVLGSLFFGALADRSGRKRLFTVTLALYIVATAASGLAQGFASLAFWRFLTGAGIGGEYSAINSAIQELVPASRRGRLDILINGSFWLGAAAAALLSAALLGSSLIASSLAWRLAFGLGAALGLIALVMRRQIPESPRWLLAHGQAEEAERIMSEIERHARVTRLAGHAQAARTPAGRASPRQDGLLAAARIIFARYPRRAVLGAVLMLAQAFFYNAFFFTYGLVLSRFDRVAAVNVGLYLLPFTLSNFLGAAVLARFFDTVGRRPMITATYGLSGVLMIVAAWLFRANALTALSQTLAWAAIFFLASAGASAAYLTVSEAFPLEIRARAIALFYSLGTAAGGVLAPALFAVLIASGSRTDVFWGYLLAATLMLLGAAVELVWGFAAEGRSLEALATPLSFAPAEAPPPAPIAGRRPEDP